METEGGKILEEEEEDENRESRTKSDRDTTGCYSLLGIRGWSCVGPDGEALLPSSVNTVCYKPIQPIQHRCPGVGNQVFHQGMTSLPAELVISG